MRLEQGVYNHLSTFAGLTALVGDRVYPMARPQNTPYPAVTFFRVSSPPIRTLGGKQGSRTRLQVSCWAKTYLEAKNVADQVIDALDGFKGTLGGGVPVMALDVENETDDNEPDTRTYHVALDFTVWHEGN